VIDFALLKAEAAAHPYPLLFATVSGADLYGFPSPDEELKDIATRCVTHHRSHHGATVR
jgi:predicted nucleotidyltransferase